MSDNEHQDAVETISKQVPREVPLLVSREVVIYPHMGAPLLIEDECAIRAVDTAMSAGHKLLRSSDRSLPVTRRNPKKGPRKWRFRPNASIR